MQTSLAAHPLSLQRPRLHPDTRPHTVHASSPSSFRTAVEQQDDDSDDQTTPRASLAGLSILAEEAQGRRSRDDTAAGMSAGVTASDRAATFGAVQRRTSIKRGFRFTAGATQGPAELTTELPLGPAKPSSNTQSLGRHFSRNYKQTMHDLRESVSKHTALPGRMRRSSIPHGIDATSSGSDRHYANPAHPQSVSPSKRNAKFSDARPRKSRLFTLSGKFNGGTSGGNGAGPQDCRKDTPAPPGFNAPRLPPVTNVFGDAPTNGWQLQGGESARAAAAAYNHGTPQQSAEPVWSQPQSQQGQDQPQPQAEAGAQHTYRNRLLSMSSAADSGADLTTFAPSPTKEDSVTDADDMVIDQEWSDTEEAPSGYDFTQILPAELVLEIFEYLDAVDLSQALRVSKKWRGAGDKLSVWREAYLRRFDRQIFTDPAPVHVGGIGVGRTGVRNQEWKKIYKARTELEANWRKGAANAGKAVYLSGHTDSVYCVQFDEEKIITGSRDRTIRVWDINTFQCLRVIGGPNVRPVLGPKVLRTVDYPAFHLATASVNGTAYGDNIFHTPSEWHDASILCLQYDEHILVTGSSDSDLIVWDIKTYEPITRLHKHTGGVLDVALDAKYIVSCSKDSRIIVWDRATYQPIGELTGHRGPVNAVQLRGKYLVSASGDGIARLWDLEQMKLVKQFEAKERGLAAVEFSEDMKYVLAGGNDHITYKFEVETGKEVLQFTGHSQLVRSLWLDSANNRVVSGSYDLDLRVYDFTTGEEIWRAEEWTTSWMLAAKSDYRRIVATSQDGRILIVDFGLTKSRGPEDGQPIENVNLLRGIESTNAIQWRDPWAAK